MSAPGERLEGVAKRADLLMFEQKRIYYAEDCETENRGLKTPTAA